MARRRRKYKKDEKFYIGMLVVSVAALIVAFIPAVGDTVTSIGEMAWNSSLFAEVSDVADNAKNFAQGISDVKDEIEEEINKEFADPWEQAAQEAADESAFGREIVTLVRVVDGDTYVVNIGGVDTKVRLIGVDTPESVAPSTYSKENTQEGKDVSDIMKNKLSKGDVLSIEYDVQKTDKYGRTLAYLYFSDGTMIQKWLLENGYAQCMTVQPNSKYAEEFASIQHTAAENKIGLWNGYFEE